MSREQWTAAQWPRIRFTQAAVLARGMEGGTVDSRPGEAFGRYTHPQPPEQAAEYMLEQLAHTFLTAMPSEPMDSSDELLAQLLQGCYLHTREPDAYDPTRMQEVVDFAAEMDFSEPLGSVLDALVDPTRETVLVAALLETIGEQRLRVRPERVAQWTSSCCAQMRSLLDIHA